MRAPASVDNEQIYRSRPRVTPSLRTGRQITFQYLLRNITAECDGYYEEAKVIYRPVLTPSPREDPGKLGPQPPPAGLPPWQNRRGSGRISGLSRVFGSLLWQQGSADGDRKAHYDGPFHCPLATSLPTTTPPMPSDRLTGARTTRWIGPFASFMVGIESHDRNDQRAV
jgi:hypothetical protein